MRKEDWNWLKIIKLIFFIVGFILSFNYINKSNEWNILLISISGIILTFIALFYSLVFKKGIDESMNEDILDKKWKSVRESIFQEKFKGSKYEQKLERVKKMQEELEEITSMEKELDMKRLVRNSTYCLIAAIILLLVDLITGWKYVNKDGSFFTLRLIGSICLFCAIFWSINMIKTWDTLNKIKKIQTH